MDASRTRVCEAAFERAVVRAVAGLFAAVRADPKATNQIPVVGWLHGVDFDPHASPEDHAQLEAIVTRAVIARKWAEDQIPKALQVALPLHESERGALNRTGDRKLEAVASYGMLLQQRHWNLDRAPTFLDHFAQRARAAWIS